MINILLLGATGRMGREISQLISEYTELTIVAGVAENHAEHALSYPVYSTLDSVKEDFDVLIDFSSDSLANSLYSFLKKNGKPAILCTTNYSQEQENMFRDLAKTNAIFRSANMSIGIYVMNELIALANKLLNDRYDISIIEKHHRYKKDKPSGTALALLESLASSQDIEMLSIRGGHIAGDHEVLFMADEEIISVSHHAENRSVFARGALEAASFIYNKPAGYYQMKDLLRQS